MLFIGFSVLFRQGNERRRLADIFGDPVVQLPCGGKLLLRPQVGAEIEPQLLPVEVSVKVHKIGFHGHTSGVADRRAHADIRHADALRAIGKVSPRGVYAALRDDAVRVGYKVRRGKQALNPRGKY